MTASDVADQQAHVVVLDAGRLVAEVVAALIDRHDLERSASPSIWRAPGVPVSRGTRGSSPPAVRSQRRVVDLHAVRVGVAVGHLVLDVRRAGRAGGRDSRSDAAPSVFIRVIMGRVYAKARRSARRLAYPRINGLRGLQDSDDVRPPRPDAGRWSSRAAVFNDPRNPRMILSSSGCVNACDRPPPSNRAEEAMLRTALVTTAVAAALVAGGSAQSRRDSTATRAAGTMSCDDRNYNDDRATHCEMREDTIGGANPLDIDAGRNGGIRVRGWDRGDVLVRSKIQASRRHRRRRAPPGRRRAHRHRAAAASAPTAPTRDRDENWSVSFEINVPRTAMLTLNTNNGGISIEDFRGTAKFHAKNGGLTLDQRRRRSPRRDHQRRRHRRRHRRSLGRRRPRRRDPQRRHPDDAAQGFSAELEAGTTHGGISIDFPVTVQGRIARPPRDHARLRRPEAARHHDQRRRHDPPEIGARSTFGSTSASDLRPRTRG